MDLNGLRLGMIVTMKKPHPCGGTRWEVVRTGADYKVRCCGCGRVVLLSHDELARRAVKAEEKDSE